VAHKARQIRTGHRRRNRMVGHSCWGYFGFEKGCHMGDERVDLRSMLKKSRDTKGDLVQKSSILKRTLIEGQWGGAPTKAGQISESNDGDTQWKWEKTAWM